MSWGAVSVQKEKDRDCLKLLRWTAPEELWPRMTAGFYIYTQKIKRKYYQSVQAFVYASFVHSINSSSALECAKYCSTVWARRVNSTDSQAA